MKVQVMEILCSFFSFMTIIFLTIRNKEKIKDFAQLEIEKMQSCEESNAEIHSLQQKIEILNRSLISTDKNLQEISVMLKKILRVYQSKEEDLKENFLKMRVESQNRIFERYQKDLLLETLETVGVQIINDEEVKKEFKKTIK
jgi:hypothetical protein